MASIRSALTIEISSITSVSIALRILRVGVGLVDLAVRDEPDRQPEQRVDRLTLDVQRRDARRRAHRDLLRRVPREVLQQRRLAGAGAPGHEDVLAGVLDEPEQRLLLGGERRAWSPIHANHAARCRRARHPTESHSAISRQRGFLDWGVDQGAVDTADGRASATRDRRRARTPSRAAADADAARAGSRSI